VLGEVPPELRVTAEQDERLAEQAARVGPDAVVRLLELLSAALRAMKDGADARTQLELALVKAATPALDPSVKALQARLARLESGPAPAGPKTPERPETAAGRAAIESRPIAASSPPADPPAEAARGATTVTVSAQLAGQPPVVASTTLPGAGSGLGAQAAADEAAAAVADALATDEDPAPAVSAVAVVDPEAEPKASFQAGADLSLEAFGTLWPAVVDVLKEERPMLAGLLEDARPAALADAGLTLTWPESSSFSKRKAEDPENRDLIAGAIRAVTGTSLRLAYELRSDADVVAAAVPAAPALSEDDLVQRFKDEFDAEELPPEPEEQT
jgi:DNA polymerase-3 subunit gamma/tau